MKHTLITLTLALFVTLFACSTHRAHAQPQPLSSFILGADISAAAAPRPGANATAPSATNPAYLDDQGNPASELALLQSHGYNAFRLRVFISPVRRAPDNSLDNTITVAKEIKAAGAAFLLDIHYSDTWADPQHQDIPVAWQKLDAPALGARVHDYTADVLSQFIAANATPDMVQVGNEITGGMLWPLGHVKVPPSTIKNDAGKIDALPPNYDDAAQWANLLSFLKAGTSAVREASPKHPIPIVIHIDCGGDWPTTQWYFDHLTAAHIEFDIIGQSYYPRYHGSLDELANNITQTAARYHKPFLIAETGYPQNGQLTPPYMTWPATPDGQLHFMSDLIATAKHAGAIGIFYWAPEGRGRGNALFTQSGQPAPALDALAHPSPTSQPAPSR